MRPRRDFQPVLVLALVVFLSLQVISNQSFVSASSALLEPATEPIPVQTNMTLAVTSYMLHWGAGWGNDTKDTMRDTNLRLSQFTPLLGIYRSFDPTAADWHIKWAMEHGVSVFFMNELLMSQDCRDWYLDFGFLGAKYVKDVRFAFTISAPTWFNNEHRMMQLLKCDLETWSSQYFGNPSYFQIRSRPVIMVTTIGESLDKWGPKVMNEFFNLVREIPREHGYEPFVIGDIFADADYITKKLPNWTIALDALATFDFNFMPPKAPNGCRSAPYTELVASKISDAAVGSGLAREYGKPFIPTVLPGFNNEKLFLGGYDNWCIKFTDPTVTLFMSMLKGVEPYVDKDLHLIFINSWNELNEMHAIEPTKEYGFTYLDMIRELFASGKPSSWPADIAPTGGGYYVEYKSDGATSTEIPINTAWSALGSATNVANLISENATSPIFRSPESNRLFNTAAKQYQMALDVFYKNQFANVTRLVGMAIQSMNAAYEADQQHPSTTTSEETSNTIPCPKNAISNPAFIVVAAMAIVLTIVALRLRSKKQGNRN